MIDWYDWAGGREAMLRFGPDHGPVVVAAMPLLEEWNRTRAFVVTLLRALADRGLASVLPDLPGHGESQTASGQLTVLRLAEALESLTDQLHAEGRPTIGLGVRSGTLLDYCSLHVGRWHLAPVTGQEVLANLHKVWLAGGQGKGESSLHTMMYGDDAVVIAGHLLSADFLGSLTCAEPFDEPPIPRRVVRLASDPRPADRHVEGPPLWRRAEPGNDSVLAATLANDIAAWTRRCAA